MTLSRLLPVYLPPPPSPLLFLFVSVYSYDDIKKQYSAEGRWNQITIVIPKPNIRNEFNFWIHGKELTVLNEKGNKENVVGKATDRPVWISDLVLDS